MLSVELKSAVPVLHHSIVVGDLLFDLVQRHLIAYQRIQPNPQDVSTHVESFHDVEQFLFSQYSVGT
jgi:hypothetical protein